MQRGEEKKKKREPQKRELRQTGPLIGNRLNTSCFIIQTVRSIVRLARKLMCGRQSRFVAARLNPRRSLPPSKENASQSARFFSAFCRHSATVFLSFFFLNTEFNYVEHLNKQYLAANYS